MAAWNPDRNRKIRRGDRASPNLVTSFALPNQLASGRTQQFAERWIELGRHLGGFGFAQGGDLQINRGGIDARMIVRQ